MSPQQSTSATRTKFSANERNAVPEKLAECYLDRPRQLNLPTTPGRAVWFIGGKATITDERDLPVVLRRDDLTIYPSERYADWWQKWLESCGEQRPAKAKIEVQGVVHEPPYATLLAQPPGEAVVGDDQGAVTRRKPTGRPRGSKNRAPAAEVTGGANSVATDPDSQQAAGGSDPLNAYVGWNNHDLSRQLAEAVHPDADAGESLGLRDADGGSL